MKSRFEKSMVRDLALVIGLPAILIALLLACAVSTAPPMAAAPARGALEPAWTSTDPVTAVVLPDATWVVEPYGVTITFLDGALRETAVFTFTPRPDLVLDPPVVSTPYVFELRGYFLNTGGSVSLWGDIKYDLLYDESLLNGVSEHSLEAYRYSDRWSPQNATVDTTANRITWETAFTGKFGVGGSGPRKYIYLPAMLHAGTVRSAQAGSQSTD